MDWRNENVLIVGAARQGTALARFVAARGGRVVLNDRASEETLVGARAALADLAAVRWALGGHPLDLLDDVTRVCVSGGVPLDLPLVAEALARGLPVTNDSQIFLEEAPCRVIGITGSAGKTTTTALVGRIVQTAYGDQAGPTRRRNGSGAVQRAWIGGNIGNPLISQVDAMGPQDLAIMELSSFQLELMTKAPQIAALLNLTPNHLDRHKTMAAYTAAKSRILTQQSASDLAILGREDPGAWGLADQVRGTLFAFGNEPRDKTIPGAFFKEGQVWFQTVTGEHAPVLPESSIALRGDHNRLNVLAAVTIALAAGISEEAVRQGVVSFQALPHRLEYIRQWGGADWYNDSIATAPERALAAIRSFSDPLILLVGGRDKDLPWDDFLHMVNRRVDHLVVFGEAGNVILRSLARIAGKAEGPTIDQVAGLREAVQVAAGLAEPGDVVLLSPGGTSFDEFRDFEERGEYFKRWVMELS